MQGRAFRVGLGCGLGAALLAALPVVAAPLQGVQAIDALVLPAELGPADSGPRLREVSGLAWDGARQRWWSVSDRGLLVAWQMSFDGGRLAATALWSGRMEGRPNAESVEVLPQSPPGAEAALAVLDEDAVQWRRIDPQGRLLATTPLAAHARADYTRGVEALARHPRHGLVVVPQRPAKGGGRAHLIVAEDGRAWTLPPAGERASIKAAHVDARGRLLLLEKLAAAALPGRWWLREVDLDACAADGRCEAPPVALPSERLADDDNLEGLACRDDAHCLVVSDDGPLPAPRTRLLWLALQRGLGR
jgi:hypothetical protein